MRKLIVSPAVLGLSLAFGLAALPVELDFSSGLPRLADASAFARRGADDPAGHVRHGNGADDSTDHSRGNHSNGADDHGGRSRGDDHGGKGGNGHGGNGGGSGRGGHDDGADHR